MRDKIGGVPAFARDQLNPKEQQDFYLLLRKIINSQAFGDYPNADYAQFEDDGTLRFYGNATSWKDLNFDVLSLSLGSSAPSLSAFSGGTILRPHFSSTITQSISGSVEIPHEAKLDVIKPHLHWLPTDATTGDVYWQLTYTLTNSGDTEPTETTIGIVTSATGTQYDNIFAVFPDIDVSMCNPGCQFCWRLFRDPGHVSDTYGTTAAVKTFGLHVEIQSLGTRTVAAE